MALDNLFLLARLTGKSELEKIAHQVERAFSQDIREQPDGYTKFLANAAVCGKDPCEEVAEMLRLLT